MKRWRLQCAAAAALVLGGCTVGPDYHAPKPAVPDVYSAQPTTRASSAPSTRPVDVTRWWQSLNDPELNALVEKAVAANLDLQIALARLQEARTYETIVEGGALPLVDATGTIARGSGTNSTKGRIGAPLNAGSNTTGLKEITQVVGFDAGWELDLFGRYRREIEAAGDEAQAAAEERNDVLIMVVADVARTYINERGLQLRLAIALDNIRIEQQTVDVVQQRFNRGITNELDLALARRQLLALEADIAPLQAEIASMRRQLAVLLGEYPQQVDQQLRQQAALPQPPAEIAPGLPLDLLRRRPDIRQAEREIAAANAQIGAATANLYPRIAITAGLGMQGQGAGRSPSINSFLWSVGPSAYWPLLDFGTLDAMIDIQDLRTREALLQYRKTILQAVAEVDDAISNYNAERQRLDDLTQALQASRRAVDLAQQRYERGIIDFLNVSDAERQLYELQDEYAVADESVVIQYIALYKALGGGWEHYQSVPPIHKPQPAIIAAVQRAVEANQRNSQK